jgi:predicted alpha/beta hydrolase family esterase
MRISDADILFVPGLGGSGPDHWQTRWENKLTTARRIEQADFERPSLEDWMSRIAEEVARSDEAGRPALLIAHSLGCLATAHAAPLLRGRNVAGAYLIAPPSDEVVASQAQIDPAFVPVPMQPLPFASVLVASRTDPYASLADAEAKAKAWGSSFVDAGEAGHINAESGHGPWPEGLMRLASFLKTL